MLVYLLISSALTGVIGDPAFPRWPDQFTQNFTDHNRWPLGWYATESTFFYDWPNKLLRIDRANGRYDRYCGTNGIYQFKDTPCTQLVVDGNRYLYYHEKKDCCVCCSEKDGCGIVKPDWMTGSEFLGNVTYDKIRAYEWDQKGLQHNYYYETAEKDPKDRTTLEIFMSPNEKQVFNKQRAKSVPADIFQLPEECTNKKACSVFSACKLVKN